MTKVLFVCWGNGNRSPMAEGLYNLLTHSKDGSSAGVNPKAATDNPHPTKNAITAIKEEGVDISSHKGQTLTEAMVEESDHIVVLCEKEVCPQFLLNSPKAIFYEVTDPWISGNIEGYRKIRDQIKYKILELIKSNFK